MNRKSLKAEIDQTRERLDGVLVAHAAAVTHFLAWGAGDDDVRALHRARCDLERLEEALLAALDDLNAG